MTFTRIRSSKLLRVHAGVLLATASHHPVVRAPPVSGLRGQEASLPSRSSRWRAACSGSTSAPTFVPLERGEVHLWLMAPKEVHDEAKFNHYHRWLSIDERAKLEESGNTDVWRERLLTRALARAVLAKYSDPPANPSDLRFKRGQYGKPKLQADPVGACTAPVAFNLSHTDSLIACAVTTSGEIGVDLESQDRTPRGGVKRLAKRFLAEPEVETIDGLPTDALQNQHFLQLWTLKEACVKAAGTGFANSPFNSFTMKFESASGDDGVEALHSQLNEVCGQPILSPPMSITITDAGDKLPAAPYRFLLMHLADSHIIALCTRPFEASQQSTQHSPAKDASTSEGCLLPMDITDLRVWKVDDLENLEPEQVQNVSIVGGTPRASRDDQQPATS